MSGRVTYMNIPAVRGDKEESFEERRIIDYLAAYRATGRPPAPCPQQPTDKTQRLAMGLPPLFEPHSEVDGPSGANGATASTSALPSGSLDFAAQAFSQTKMKEYETDAYFQSIVAQPAYSKYSVEELRVEAYRLGKKVANVPSTQFSQQPQRPALLPSISLRSSSQSTYPESLQSVNSMPPYDQHSFEELRLACLRAGRPLSSAEIIAQNAVLRMSS